MKGFGKALSRESQDAEANELIRKFTLMEEYTTKLIKDTSTFRDSVATMITSQDGFGTAFATIFQPILNEASLTSNHPEAADTLRNISSYKEVMAELRDAIQPELELIDSRVTAPLKEYNEMMKKIRKTITKRDHKLVDYDRHNNSFNKLKDKKEKSLSDEKNLFKIEQDLEQATNEYEHYNGALKAEIPHFFQLSTAFIAPLFQTFYFIKVGILYTLLEKIQGWAGETYGDMNIEGLEQMHMSRFGEAAQAFDEMTINKRSGGTARIMAQHRQNSGDSGSSFGRTSTLGRAPSTASSLGRAPSTGSSFSKPPIRSYGAPAAAAEPSPPPYSGSVPTGTTLAGKRPPPPPPNKPRMGGPQVTYVTALYDYAATADGDLSFNAGDKIELVKKTDSAEDWWTGKVNGQQGVFPGNYVQL
ncbi:BAR adaptor protein [Pseudohyphozyma bogoriensis]|nr:BAR adaptor protein [Pseudohyphozyma bogoriensis]